MENKQMDERLEQKIRGILTGQAPEPEIVDKKMKEAYKEIREMQTPRKKKLPFLVKIGTVAAVLALAMVYCVKNPAVAAQIPLIGNIFRGMEGELSFPGDYSKKSVKLAEAPDAKFGEKESIQSGKSGEKESIQSGKSGEKDERSTKPDSAAPKQTGDSYRKTVDGVTVTLSEAAYDHDAIFLALLVENEKGFVKDPLYPNSLTYDAKVKLIKKDGSSTDFSYKSEGLFTVGIDGEYIDSHTFKGVYQFREESVDLSEYVACKLTFGKFQQELKTGEEETIIVPDYGEVTRTIPDSKCYNGPWKFRLDLDGITIHEQETDVSEVNDEGFGIEKIVKTEYEMYAVPILPEGVNVYDYVVTIWDADGKPLENRNAGKYLTMSHYGRDVSEVTLYLLKAIDFLDNKAENAYLQPGKAVYKTKVRIKE